MSRHYRSFGLQLIAPRNTRKRAAVPLTHVDHARETNAASAVSWSTAIWVVRHAVHQMTRRSATAECNVQGLEAQPHPMFSSGSL